MIKSYFMALACLLLSAAGTLTHAQSISTGTITGSPFATGGSITVPYTATGTFNAGNIFTAQLSDAQGVFPASPVAIGTLAATASGSIAGTVPTNIPGGYGYRVRVVAGSPVVTGTANGSNLTVTATAPQITSFSPASGAVGTTVTITGANFSTTAAQNVVFFGPVKATPTAATATSLTVTVPVGATTAPPTVVNLAGGNSGSSTAAFRVTYPVTAAFTTASLSSPANVSTTTSGHGLLIVDVDGDGKNDLVSAVFSGNFVSVFRNISTPGTLSATSFAAAVNFTVNGAFCLAAEDLNGDGKKDIIVGTYGSQLQVFTNLSSPGSITTASLSTAAIFTAAGAVANISTGDLDGNGRPDIVFNYYNATSPLSILPNYTVAGATITTASFGATVQITATPATVHAGVVICDLDGDGRLDIAGGYSADFALFRNTGTYPISTATFPTAVLVASGGTGGTEGNVRVADLNGDGKPELVRNNIGGNTVSLIQNNSTSGSFSFGAAINLTVAGNNGALDLEDMNGDGKTDLVVANSNVNSMSVVLNNATGTLTAASFAAAVAFTTGGFNICQSVGDLDGDGRPDIASGNFNSNTIGLYRNLQNLSTGVISGSPFLPGAAVTVPYTTGIAFNAGNVFTAQLSDAAGSFTSPVSIGTVTATASGTIAATIPANALPGTGYRIRVVASNPAVTGTDNGANLTIGTPANALSFDGVDDYVTLGASALLRPTAGVTVAVWAYSADWTVPQLTKGLASNTQNGGYALALNGSGNLHFNLRRNGVYSAAVYPVSGLSAGWHHFAGTFDGRYVKLFTDGVERSSTDAGATYPISYNVGNSFIVGGSAGAGAAPEAGNFFTGNLDELSIWSRALCPAELQNLMSGMLTTPAAQTGLIGYYQFNQGAASGNNAGITTLTDAGPNGLPGTLTNFVLTGATSNFVSSTVGTTTAPQFTSALATNGLASTQTISGSTQFTSSCYVLSNIAPAGAEPVSGNVTTTVRVDGSVQSYLGRAYVQRHFDIEPATTPNSATATVTLYFTQSEFTAYNAANGTDPDLPANSGDATGAANLRINQFHGTSASGTPGTYSGWAGAGPAIIVITPTSVSWNATFSRWEAVIPVTGFSGFFAAGAGFSGGVPLPIEILSFSAQKSTGGNLVKWSVAKEESGTMYSIERSADGRNFSGITAMAGEGQSAYNMLDAQALAGNNYYRLRISVNNKVSYSGIALVRGESNTGAVTVSPVPASNSIRIRSSDVASLNQIAVITDMAGREVHRFILIADQQIDVHSWPAGVYSLKAGSEVIRIVKQ